MQTENEKPQPIIRYMEGTVALTTDAKPKLRGRAVVYNSLSRNLGGFVERILPGAFSESLKNGDIRVTINHDDALLLGRTSTGTAKVWEDEQGIMVEVDPPDTSYAKDLAVLIQRGDMRGMSFKAMLRGSGRRWTREAGRNVHEVIRGEMDECAFVGNPAYGATNAEYRSLELAQQLDAYGMDVDRLKDILCAVKRGMELTQDEQEIAAEAIKLLQRSQGTPKLDAIAARLGRAKDLLRQ